MNELYYIQDGRQHVGNNLLFWAKECRGYTCHLDEAELFTKEEATEVHLRRSSDIPVLKSLVDKAASLQVDVQRMTKADKEPGK